MRGTVGDDGFTLVEVMVVVLIIGILVAIAVPIFNLAKANTQRSACWASQRTIEGAAQSYNTTNHFMPASIDSLVPAFLKTVPKCPAVQVAYAIDASGTVSCNGSVGCSSHLHY